MLAPLVPAALCLIASGAPRTTGAYVPAGIADCFEQGGCSGLDLEFAPFLRFAEGALTVDWITESATVRARGTPRGLEFQRDPAGPWKALAWRVLPDGAVETDAFLQGARDRVRWIADDPDALARQWEERWTAAQLARLSGTWGSGPAAITIRRDGVEQRGLLHRVIARPCFERCVGPAFHVCLVRRPSSRPATAPADPLDAWVLREERLEPVERGKDPCDAFRWPSVEGFEPHGSPLLRRTLPPKAKNPMGIPQETVAKAVAARARVEACVQGASPAPVDLSVTVQPCGLPSKVSVKGVDGQAAACLEKLLWGLILPPAEWGAPPTQVDVRVELPSR